MRKSLFLAFIFLFIFNLSFVLAIDSCKGLTEPACNITANCTWDMGLNGCMSDCFQFSGTDLTTCESAFGTGVCSWNSTVLSCKPKFLAFAETCMNLNYDSVLCDAHPNCDWEEYDLKCVIDCFQFDFTSLESCESAFGGDICKWDSLSSECNPAYFNPGWSGGSPCFEFDGDMTGCEGLPETCVWFPDSYCTEGNPCYDPVNPGWCNPKQINIGGDNSCYLYDGNKSGCEYAKQDLMWACEWSPDVWGPLKEGTESGWCNSFFAGSGTSGCWEYITEPTCLSAADMGMPCVWKNDNYSMNGGWCEQLGCWSFQFSINETTCINDSAEKGLNCQWDSFGNYCYEVFEGCSSFNNDEFGCYSTGWCIWDASQMTCSEPVFEFTYFNPGCWIFDQPGEEKCNNVSTCLWNAGNSICEDNGAMNNNGVQCVDIINADMCNNIPVLSACCSWNGTGCQDAPYTDSCRKNIPMLPEGAMFCDDYNAIFNETLCNLISSEPWYMPCVWNSTKGKCGFEFENFFNTPDFTFMDITSQTTCEASGGIWHEEQWTNFEGIVQTDKWCEFGFGINYETCNSACWACEFDETGSDWSSLADARNACENSNVPDGCIFIEDPNAFNNYGWCNFNFTFNPFNFVFEDCFGFMDEDGDGLMPDEDPDCKDFFNFGYIQVEHGTECLDGFDNDGNGLEDCNDFGCMYDDYYCNLSNINDTAAPIITWLNVDEFLNGAFIMIDTNEPTNATLFFYEEDATCTTLNNTIFDTKLNNNFTKDDYDFWHDLPVDEYYFDKLGIDFDFEINTTYYYEVILCDKSGNCANSDCSNFKTRAEANQFFVGFQLPPPQSDTTDLLGKLNVNFNWAGGTGNITGGTGLQFNESDSREINITFTNPDAANPWSITFIGADFSSAQNINITDAFVADDSSGDILLGMKKDKWKEMAQKLGVDYIQIVIPQGVTNINLGGLKHCPDDAVSPEDPDCIEIDLSDVSCIFSSTETVCDIPTTIGFSVFAVFMAETIASSGGNSNNDVPVNNVTNTTITNVTTPITTPTPTAIANNNPTPSNQNNQPSNNTSATPASESISDKTLVILGVIVIIIGLALYLVTQLRKPGK